MQRKSESEGESEREFENERNLRMVGFENEKNLANGWMAKEPTW